MSWMLIMLAAIGVGLLVRHESRTTDPLIPPGLMRSRATAGANVTALALTASTTPAMYLATLYVQQVLHLSPARACVLFPVFNGAVIAGSILGPWLLKRLGPRGTLINGFVGIGSGAAVLITVQDAGGATTKLLLSFALMGSGLGAASVASTHTGTDAVAEPYRGVAAGVLTAAAQIGTAVGLAVITPLATSSSPSNGYLVGFTATAALAVIGLLSSLLVPRRHAAVGSAHYGHRRLRPSLALTQSEDPSQSKCLMVHRGDRGGAGAGTDNCSVAAGDRLRGGAEPTA
jgi:MFS family permease